MVVPIRELLADKRVVLGSQSPRRVELLREMGIDCVVMPSCADESHMDSVLPKELPLVLAKRKADALMSYIGDRDLLITTDTIVALGQEVLEKPRTLMEAKSFLQSLSGQWHSVYSAFVIRHRGLEHHEVITTDVRMLSLDEDEIDYYVNECSVLDKAGGYGIQDWIGTVGIAEIRGCYNNVVGLPTAQLYQALKKVLSAPKSTHGAF